eukprot:TRINITY_DN30586_c0_g1_i1.p1 TRINITY_DN30586_c0_g1~~TRINITY_DN30586_c0_g1_i1.p1  ORF type:complete len:272 (+),score=27.92 TRINITY_DN30586_c0_g1_i1:901-1716(+)
MELFYYALSINSHKVRMVVEEKNLCTDVQLVHVDVLRGASLEPDYLRVNENGTVPSLVMEGDLVLKDSKAIVEYLDSFGSEGPLGGSATVDRAKVAHFVSEIDAWNDQAFTYGHLPRHQALTITRFKRRLCIERMARNPSLAVAYSSRLSWYQSLEQEMQDGEQLRVATEKLSSLLNEAERALEVNLFVAGGEFTIADSCFAAVLARVESLGLMTKMVRKGKPNVFEYFRRMQRRPSYRRAIGRYSNGIVQRSFTYPSFANMRYRRVLRSY